MRTATAIVFLIAVLNFAPAAVPAAAQDAVLGNFKGWEAYTFKEKGRVVCALWRKPDKSAGKYKKRGAVRVFIAHRTWARPKRINEVSFEAGYPFKKDSEATVAIDGKRFTLFTAGDTAWNRTARDDAKMVKAMRIGKTMVVKGVSARGTRTTDTYSLFGFTAAHNAINNACKIK